MTTSFVRPAGVPFRRTETERNTELLDAYTYRSGEIFACRMVSGRNGLRMEGVYQIRRLLRLTVKRFSADR